MTKEKGSMFKLRRHQSDALKSIDKMGGDKGRIVIPTGGGKTAVEAFALRDMINLDGREVHLVLAPRIALVNQLINEYRNYIGSNYLAVAFHSGKYEPDYTKVRWSETSTTLLSVVEDEYKRALSMDKDLVIFSTYASAHKLVNMKFDSLIADESQYLVAENFFETARDIDATKKLFFTATERHTESSVGRGLNNEEVFGPILYQVAPKTLIAKGYIVPPRLHVMAANERADTYTVMDEVVQIASKQIEMSTKESPDLPVSKVLFAMSGTNDVKEVVENIKKIKAAIPGYTIFTIVSNTKYGAMVDGNKIARGDFLKVLRETDKALIFHYDILSEGIDIDGITGVAILRNMKHAKLLQTIGRAVRIYKANPEAKKFCWVSVTQINEDRESSDFVAKVALMIRNGGFEVNSETVEFTNAPNPGIADPEEIDPVTSPDAASIAMSKLEKLIHHVEKMSFIEDISTVTIEATIEDYMEAV
jgi:superfamily II DNA or RNA helicase